MEEKESKDWSGKSRGGKFGYLFFVYVIRLLGVRGAYFFMAIVLLHFIPFAPKATIAIWKYNRKRLHLGLFKSVVMLYKHYYVFGQTLIDRVALRSGKASEYKFKFDNYDRFLEIINGRDGAVLIGAHVGCWEAGSVFFGNYGKKINIVMFDSEHSEIKQVMDEVSKQQNFKIISVSKDTIGAMLRIKCALNEGEYVCFNGDRYLDANQAAITKFLSAKAQFPIGPFKIASRCRKPVVFYYAMREKNRTYRFIFDEMKANKSRDYQIYLDEYIQSLESIVRRYPQQWFNFYDFWKLRKTNINEINKVS